MRRFLAAVVIATCLVPAVSSASTIEDLTDQIAVLLAQLHELQLQVVQATTLENSSTSTPAPAPAPTYATPVSSSTSAPTPSASAPAVCPTIVRSLVRGQRGDDVLQLQNFLVAQGALSTDSATGFFGPVTETAVQTWQSNNNVVSSGTPNSTGWGVVGTRTRAAIRVACGDTSAASANDYLSVSTLGMSSNAKVIVNAVGSCAPYEYTLNFGDGSEQKKILVPADLCHPITMSAIHEYPTGGNFTVTLVSGRGTISVPVTAQNAPAVGAECKAPSFATDIVPTAFLSATWTMPIVVASISGLPSVTVSSLPTGITLQKQLQISAQSGTSSDAWILTGIFPQVHTYVFGIQMENACGKINRTITIPVNQFSVSSAN